MEVIYHNRRRAPEDIEQSCRAVYVDKASRLSRADIVTLHVPDTHHLIGAAELARMNSSAVLINTSRSIRHRMVMRAARNLVAALRGETPAESAIGSGTG